MTDDRGPASPPTPAIPTAEGSTPTATRELLEDHGRIYGELRLALTFTRTNDRRKATRSRACSAGALPSLSRTPHEALR